MKKLLLITLIFLTWSISSNAQEELRAGEFIIDFVNRPSLWSFTVKIEAIGTVWNHYHDISTAYLGGTKNYSSQTSPPAPFWHASDLSWDDVGWEPVLSLGLYEVSIWEGSNKRAWFFIDYRTSHLPYAAGQQLIDVVLDYDVTNKDFSLTYPNLGSVNNGSYYPIWELKELVQLQTDDLEDYWDNCLAVFNNGANHPKFAWGPYPGFSNNYYRIYKKKETPNFVLYDSTTSTTYLDVNEEILTGPPQANEGHIYYKVTSVGYPTDNPFIPPYESGYSNTVDIRSLMSPLEKQGINSTVKNAYNLFQNYPNPFNPITTITFNIPQSEKVTITVFDILGREVAELINEQKEAGTHTIKYDASNMTSGIYFYQIKAGEYSEVRKLILQK